MKEYDPTTIKKYQQISLKIKRLGINGEGIGYYKKLIIFVPGALPKEEVTATITNVTPKFAEGTLQSVKKAAKDRVVPPCPVYETWRLPTTTFSLQSTIRL